jgi:hypothetical protein
MAILQGPDTDPSVLGRIRDAAAACLRANFVCVNYRCGPGCPLRFFFSGGDPRLPPREGASWLVCLRLAPPATPERAAQAASCARNSVSPPPPHLPRRKDGSKFVNRLQISPLYNSAGAVSHLLGVLCPAPEDGWRLAYERAGREALEGFGAPSEGGEEARDGAGSGAQA